MERPKLLWVNMCKGAHFSGPASELTRHGDVRLIEPYQLFAALKIAATTDVVCFDFDQPDMDGLKLVAETKASFPSLPIIMMIEHHSTDIMLWALRTRVFDLLLKPLKLQDLTRCMQRLVQVLQARRTQSMRSNVTHTEVLPESSRFRARTKVRERLRSIISYISNHYTQPITECEMAKLSGMSTFRFSKAFRAVYGITFRDYLSDLRLARSRRLLENPRISVTDVAALSGFNDPSYFARLFRAKVGVSPTSYRLSKRPDNLQASVSS